ncbi:hypothetical protein HYH03_003057 [Edaphochlamys debaryana]|uniref:Uncharacterized protein n=1 Tax=Edaphochlamys debaryana TaxID=47281 RepID=A0A836C3J5_9CHLO|nr:hypothetical protein HYH03_003057 [Edaphochlamys debaryana]|eukprot:KAG2498865.1 hypothetical protein HYH03_003057 [Edaphochlamys debaryana]
MSSSGVGDSWLGDDAPGVPSRTFAALQFQAVRMREKTGTLVHKADHRELMSAAVDKHMQNLSRVGANLPKGHQHQSEIRTMHSSALEEVEEFNDFDDDPELPSTPDHASGTQLDAADAEQPRAAGPSGRWGAPFGSNTPRKGGKEEEDPMQVLKRMRSTAASKSQAARDTLDSLKGPGHNVALPEDAEADEVDEVTSIKGINSLRGRSFLQRPGDVPGGAADDMLAQLRGKWTVDNDKPTRTKSFMVRIELPNASPGVTASGGSASTVRPMMSASSKSFSAAKRVTSSALPGVSVDAAPRSSRTSVLDSGEFERGIAAPSPTSVSAGLSPLGVVPTGSPTTGGSKAPSASGVAPGKEGIFSKLKHMIGR